MVRKIIDDQIAQKTWDEIKNLSDAYQRTAYALDHQQNFSIQIIPDESIGASKFKPHPTQSNSYLAHPLTIYAMRHDIFVLGDDVVFTDVECERCRKVVEKECWKVCPFCAGNLKIIQDLGTS